MISKKETPQPDRSRTGWAAAAVALALVLIHALLTIFLKDPDGRALVSNLVNPVVGLLAGAILSVAAWKSYRYSHRLALGWAIIAAAQFFSVAGDIYWAALEMLLKEAPTPSPADILYLLSYPFFLAAVFVLPSRKVSAYESVKNSIDMLIVMLAAALSFWNFLLGPLAASSVQDPLLVKLFSLAYPVGDLVQIFAVLLILYHLPDPAFRAPFWFLAAASVVIIFCDGVYGYQSLLGTYESGNFIDIGYTTGYAFFILAGAAQYRLARAVHGSQWAAASNQKLSLPSWIGYMPYLWVALAYMILIRRNFTEMSMSMPEISISVGVLTLLVLLRQLIAVKENQDLSEHLQSALSRQQQQATELEQANHDLQLEVVERKRAEEKLSHDALHDVLTGLPNRVLFLNRLSDAARRKKRHHDSCYSVLFLDIDSFKVINDSLGHASGDYLLIRIAHILSSCVRTVDTVARLGGDEFVVLLEDIADRDQVMQVANRMQADLNQPQDLKGTTVFISASIGIVLDVDERQPPEDVLRDADLAMYQAKFNGKGASVFFDPSMHDQMISRLALENDMRRALDCHEFVLYYQPIFSLPDEKLAGFEALVRWQHPERGLLLPAEFIHVAEDTGLIIPLGRWILYEACQQMHTWLSQFPAMLSPKMSVNISGKQLKQPDFAREVAQVLKDTQLPGQYLDLELTESIFLDNPDAVMTLLDELKQMDVETQIDDFGTGYSSLGYLQHFPIRSIKIDRVFVKEITNQNPEMVRAIMSIVRDLGMKAVAEGIETEAELEELNKLGCSSGQGFMLAKPMDGPRLENWVNTHVPELLRKVDSAQALNRKPETGPVDLSQGEGYSYSV
jgi:diguanylate cyclase (GGDEF)-like protein